MGKFFSVDPLAKKYPQWSPYAFSGNQVIHTVELEGLEPWKDINRYGKDLEKRDREKNKRVSSDIANTATSGDVIATSLGLSVFNPEYIRDIGYSLQKTGLFKTTSISSSTLITISSNGVVGTTFMDDAFQAGANVMPKFFDKSASFISKNSLKISSGAVILDMAAVGYNIHSTEQSFQDGLITKGERDAEITSSIGGFGLRSTIAGLALYNPYAGTAGVTLFATNFVAVIPTEEGGLLRDLGYTHRPGLTTPFNFMHEQPSKKPISMYDIISNGFTREVERTINTVRVTGWRFPMNE